jgi:hypothetical protein
MANQKISELPAVATPSASDVLPVVNAGATKKCSWAQGVNAVFQSRKVYNVTAFGADATGVANSTAAFNLAISTAAANGGAVSIPPGSYLLDTVTLAPDVSIYGAGRRSTNLYAANNSVNVLAYTGEGVGLNVNDLTIWGNSKSSVTGIKISGIASSPSPQRVSNVYLSNLEIIGCNSGIELSYNANVKVNNAYLAFCRDGVTTSLCADVDLTNVTVQLGSQYGFNIIGDADSDTHYDEGIRLIGCSTNGQEYGLYVTGHDWGCVTGCSFTTAPSGAAILSAANNWKFSSCEFAAADPANSGSSCILNTSCSNLTFTGCQFYLSAFGLVISDGSKIAVNGCSFQSNNYQDILIGNVGAATYCTVTGNTFSSDTNASGIYEYIGSNYNVITSNSIKRMLDQA